MDAGMKEGRGDACAQRMKRRAKEISCNWMRAEANERVSRKVNSRK
jgi:hypothetical protein